MSENDDSEDRRGKESNVGREHKPKESRNYEKAPTGHLGMEVVFTPSPSLAKAIRKARPTSAIEQSKLTAEPREPDVRPLAMETGIEEIDKQTIENGERPVSPKEYKALTQHQEEGKSKAGPSVEDIFFKFTNDKEQDRGRG